MNSTRLSVRREHMALFAVLLAVVSLVGVGQGRAFAATSTAWELNDDGDQCATGPTGTTIVGFSSRAFGGDMQLTTVTGTADLFTLVLEATTFGSEGENASIRYYVVRQAPEDGCENEWETLGFPTGCPIISVTSTDSVVPVAVWTETETGWGHYLRLNFPNGYLISSATTIEVEVDTCYPEEDDGGDAGEDDGGGPAGNGGNGGTQNGSALAPESSVVVPSGAVPSLSAEPGTWVTAGGSSIPLAMSSPTQNQLRYVADGLTVTFTGVVGSSVANGLVADVNGVIVCEVCVPMVAGQVVEVWMFSTPRLVAAHRTDDSLCQRFVIPMVAPLDGGGPVAAGVHTLQVVFPTESGMQAVNASVTLGVPVPASVPAGHGPVRPVGWLLALGFAALGARALSRTAAD